MKNKKMRVLVVSLMGVTWGLAAGVSPALASSDYPNRPIEIVVPYGPGGGADIASSAYKDRAAKILGQPVVSIFKPGAGGATGSAFVANSKPNGYTFLVGSNSPLVIAPLTKKGTGYTLDDFTPVTNFSAVPLVWCVKEDSPYKTMKDFLEAAKTQKMKYSTYGALTAAHISMEALGKMAKFQAIHIPYAGAAKAMAAALGGHVDIAISSGSAGMAGPGKLRILATAHTKRLEAYPQAPTLEELGYPIYGLTYFGLWAPKGTPKEIVQKVYGAVKKAADENRQEIMETLKRVEHTMLVLSPEELWEAFQKDLKFQKKFIGEMGALVK